MRKRVRTCSTSASPATRSGLARKTKLVLNSTASTAAKPVRCRISIIPMPIRTPESSGMKRLRGLHKESCSQGTGHENDLPGHQERAAGQGSVGLHQPIRCRRQYKTINFRGPSDRNEISLASPFPGPSRLAKVHQNTWVSDCRTAITMPLWRKPSP
jgi:hypothetical protein